MAVDREMAVKCEHCRTRKLRCFPNLSNLGPGCSNCYRLNISCVVKTVYGQSQGPGKVPKRQMSVHTPTIGATSTPPLRSSSRIQCSPASSIASLGPEVTKVYLGIDLGSAFSSVTYHFQAVDSTEVPLVCQQPVLHRLRPVMFANQTQVPTIMAVGTADDGGRRFLFGEEVEYGLSRQTIQPEDVMRWIKIAAFDHSPAAQGDRDRLLHQMRRLGHEFQFRQDEASDELRRLSVMDLFSEFLGFLWRSSLKHMKANRPSLPWNLFASQEHYRGVTVTDMMQFEVAIAVPALSSPEQVHTVIDAASAAGLPPPFPVCEPAAGIYCVLQQDFENANVTGRHLAHSFVIVDIGGGTADLVTFSIASISPLKLREEVAGEGSFCGGRFVNKAARDHFEHNFGDYMDTILRGLANNRREMTKSQFLDLIETEFEVVKKRFRFTSQPETEIIGIEGLPVNSSLGLEAGRIVLTKQEMQDIFQRPLQQALDLTRRQIQRYNDKRLGHGRGGGRLKSIFLVGGSSNNEYVQEVFRRAFQLEPYRIPVAVPDSSSPTTIAYGAALALLDKQLVTSRVLRRSYGVSWDVEAEDVPQRLHGNAKIAIDDFDKRRRLLDMSKFLFKIGDRVNIEHRKKLQGGWRGVYCREKERILKETIYFSDSTSKDNLAVNDPENDIHRLGDVRIELTDEQCMNFQQRQWTERKNGRWEEFWRVEYEVTFTLRGMIMEYELAIPKTGIWPPDGADRYGPGLIRGTGRFLNCGGAFQLYNTA